jgi:cytosine/uracil/thiamine/allantoin permease
MRANGQCKFVMGAMLGFLWCAWAMVDLETKPYNFLAKFVIGLWAILGIALIDQWIENKWPKADQGGK